MDDKLLINAACNYLGIRPGQVLKSRMDFVDEVLILVVNKGILGCPKYRIPLVKLQEVPAELEEVGADTKITTTLGDGVKIVMEEMPPEVQAANMSELGNETTTMLEPDATSAAAKLAKELGIDLRLVTGTGSGGRITKRDVEVFADADYS